MPIAHHNTACLNWWSCLDQCVWTRACPVAVYGIGMQGFPYTRVALYMPWDNGWIALFNQDILC